MSDQLGTPGNPLRVAIVGSGPAGFYAAEHLLRQEHARRRGRRLRPPADAVRAGARRRRARPPEDQVGDPRLREDGGARGLSLLRQRRGRARPQRHRARRALPRRDPRLRLADRPPARHPRRGPGGEPSGHRLRRLVQRPPRLRRARVRPLVRARGRDRQRQRRHGPRPHARPDARGARDHRHRRPRDRGPGGQQGTGDRRARPSRPRPGRVHQPRAARAGRDAGRGRGRRPRRDRARRSQPRVPRLRGGGHHDSQERRDLHRVLAAPAGGQAKADRAALPSLAGRDPGRRQGRAAGRGAQRALPRRGGRDPASRHRRARDARVRARLSLDRLQGGRPGRASRSTSVAA